MQNTLQLKKVVERLILLLRALKKTISPVNVTTILLTMILFCSNISIQADTLFDTCMKNNQIYDNESCSSSVFSESFLDLGVIIQEDFTNGKIPPVDSVYGPWVHSITANDATWHIDDSHPYSDPYCATIHRGDYKGTQDEWLITPRINFSSCDTIHLRFQWYTSHFAAVWKDLLDFNVSISTDDGLTWTVIWNEDDVESPFISWEWQDSDDIDLSAYAKENNVKIGFRYYANTIEDAYAQEFSIDDIQIRGDSQEFTCDAGGPYEISWSWNRLNGVKFHGSTQGGKFPFSNWTWDFGDGHTSKIHYCPKWTYNDIGTYNVTLTVIDSAIPNNRAVDRTTVKVVETEPTCVEIAIKPSIGLQVEVKNTGTLNVSHVNWTMMIEAGPLYILHREVGKGIIPFIEAKSYRLIQSSDNIIWFGIMRVKIEVEPLNACRVELQQKLFVIGIYIFPLVST